MQQVNYQETIVIPTLQKKLQELQSTNLVLEVSLMVEQAKVKDIQTYHQRQVSEYESKTLNSTDLKNKLNAASDENAKNLRTIESLQQQVNTVTSELNSIKSNLSREVSVKESVMNEYNTLKNNFDSLNALVQTLKNENELLKTATEEARKKITPKKKKEEVMLDGETY